MLNACKHANSPRFDNTYYNFYWGDKLDYKKRHHLGRRGIVDWVYTKKNSWGRDDYPQKVKFTAVV